MASLTRSLKSCSHHGVGKATTKLERKRIYSLSYFFICINESLQITLDLSFCITISSHSQDITSHVDNRALLDG